MKILLQVACFFFPWSLRRLVLEKWCGCQLGEGSSIGLSIVLCDTIQLGDGSRIGHLNLIKNLTRVVLGEHSSIGNLNWITGFPKMESPHFAEERDRIPELILGRHSAITNRHLIDCTNRVRLGDFTTFAGFRSQILTHSVDIAEGRQASQPVEIGNYCFVGTNCVLLGGSALPSFSVLGAKSLLNKIHATEYRLYGGVPAREISELSSEAKYFTRQRGFID